jgi:Tfp pilus assembly protein PilF
MTGRERDEQKATHSSEAHLSLARSYLQKGLDKEALETLEHLLTLDPTNVEARAEITALRDRLGLSSPLGSA